MLKIDCQTRLFPLMDRPHSQVSDRQYLIAFCYISCLNIHGNHITAKLFLLTLYIYIYIYIPRLGFCKKTNVIYKFKCPLGDCISDNNNISVGLTSTTLSRRLTMHLSDTSSIAQHLKKHSCPTTQLRKILTDNTTILEH